MGRGDGQGTGVGEGCGAGRGKGCGENGHDTVAVCGGCGAVCLIVCFCTIGIPALVAGGILIAVFDGVL